MKHVTNTTARASGRCLKRLPEVMPQVGLKRSAIYDKIKNGEFPKPISLGPRAVAWIADEIDQWVDARIEASRNAVGGR